MEPNQESLTRAQEFHRLGQSLCDEGKEADAIGAYLKAINLDPDKSESYYNIGLIYKYQNEWEKSLEFNTKAYQLDPSHEASRWNLAIAATALKRWDIARKAWTDNGIDLDGESGPIEMNFGITPVRLNPDDDAEVVWSTRIDPVRAKIENIPYKKSGFKYGDVVLHDGAPVGTRKNGDREYSVFNVLALFESSKYETAEAKLDVQSEADLEILASLLSTTPHHFEDWSSNVRTLCKQCSEGAPHARHDSELKNKLSSRRTIGIAIFNGESVDYIFDDWERTSGGKLLDITY